jgi:hypothetical protein
MLEELVLHLTVVCFMIGIILLGWAGYESIWKPARPRKEIPIILIAVQLLWFASCMLKASLLN